MQIYIFDAYAFYAYIYKHVAKYVTDIATSGSSVIWATCSKF